MYQTANTSYWICSECMNIEIRQHNTDPHALYFNTLAVPYKERPCDSCQEERSCVNRPDILKRIQEEIAAKQMRLFDGL